MPFPLQHVPPALTQNVQDRPAHERHYDVTWNRPIFRAPSLPTSAQIWSEIPFTAHFGTKSFHGKAK